MSRYSSTDGFTAVELLITLFVAALFLFTGYQLYNVVLSSGTTARSQAIANTTANTYLQQYSESVTTPCAPSTPISWLNSAITVEGLSNTKVTVTISCPLASTPNLSKVSVTVTYGTGADAGTVNRVAFRSGP